MKISSTYRVKIRESRRVFDETTERYREAVDFFIALISREWEATFSRCVNGKDAVLFVERLSHKTRNRTNVPYDFDIRFPKFPSYLRRSAISFAFGAVSSYRSRLERWNAQKEGKAPGLPKAGRTFPALYEGNMFVRTDRCHARIKVWIRNTWDWIDVSLKKSDVDYIALHCAMRKACVPTLRKRGKNWYMDFTFEEKVQIEKKDLDEQLAVGIDLGINNACTCSVMRSDGTVVARHFLRLGADKDSLSHALSSIKRAQRHGARRMPRLWAKAKGINKGISAKTADYVMRIAELYNADVIVFEHLDLKGRKRGSKKQRLHHWKAQEVQRIVTDRAHRLSMSVRHICAWGTSRLAFDGSGPVERDKDNYSLCTFANGKHYNADLSASYNIAARYFIRELMQSVPERVRQSLEAKVPEAAKRTTCTLSTLRRLNHALAS